MVKRYTMECYDFKNVSRDTGDPAVISKSVVPADDYDRLAAEVRRQAEEINRLQEALKTIAGTTDGTDCNEVARVALSKDAGGRGKGEAHTSACAHIVDDRMSQCDCKPTPPEARYELSEEGSKRHE